MGKNRFRHNPKDPLFREATEDVKPIKHDRVEPFRRNLRPRPLAPHPSQHRKSEDELTDFLSESEIETGEELYFSRPGVQHRLMRDLARGRLEIGETLDLHGLSTSHAREELAGFLEFCHRHRIRCVRIIHGKGYGSPDRQPVLKQRVNLWLRQRRDVLGFCSAPRRDGGTGAVYALLSGRFRGRP